MERGNEEKEKKLEELKETLQSMEIENEEEEKLVKMEETLRSTERAREDENQRENGFFLLLLP